MATPYFQLRLESVPSTQDVARANLDALPVLVVAAHQSQGRGRSGSMWLTAERALAVSLAWRHDEADGRPFSLMAGVAAVRALTECRLKWPNDLLLGGRKVGGILVERTSDVTVVGLGLNLWWADPSPEVTALYESDPGERAHIELGSSWGANLMELIDTPGWPRDEYRGVCSTIGEEIRWDPDGRGRAVDVAEDGSLVTETPGGVENLYSGAIRHVRTVTD